MTDEPVFTRPLPLVMALIISAVMTIFILTTLKTSMPYQPESPFQIHLRNEFFCPKCFSLSGLEPTGYNAVRCKNCGFIFSFRASTP